MADNDIDYQNIINLDPNNAYRHYHDWGLALAKQKRHEDAIEKYKKAIECNPDFVNAYDSLGWVLADQQDYGEAIKQFKKAIELRPPDVDRYYLSWGWALANQNVYEDAINKFKEAICRNPDYADAYHSLGLTLVKMKRHKEAIDQYKKANVRFKKLKQVEEALHHSHRVFNLEFKIAQVYLSWGRALADLREYPIAIKLYEKAVKVHPDYADAYDSWGWAFANQGRNNEAIRAFEEAIRCKPDCVGAYNGLGIALANTGKYDEAIEKFQKAIATAPDKACSYNNLGWALAHQGRYNEALDNYQQAISTDHDYVSAYHNIANAYWEQGKYQQGWKKWLDARDAYERMAEKTFFSNNSDYYYYYGAMLHEIFGDFRKSEKVYKKGLELDPNNALIWTGLTNLYFEDKDEIKLREHSVTTSPKRISTDPYADAYWHAWDAYKRSERLIETNSTTMNVFVLQQLAELHLAMDEHDKAKKLLTDILENNNEYAPAYNNFGIMYSRQEDFKTAIRYFEAAKKRDPHNLTIRSNLAEAYRNDQFLSRAELEYKEILSITPCHFEAQVGLGEVYTAFGDMGDSELYAHAVHYFDQGIKIAIAKSGRRLKKKKIAAAYYSSGYAKIRLYETSGIMRNESLIQKALRDFKNCFNNDRDHHKAKLAQEKLERSLSRFAPRKLAETIAPWTIFLLSIIVFGLSQYGFFFAKRIGNDGYYALLTFGSLILAAAGLFLPHILKLRVGAFELEKSPSEQITTLSLLGITK